MIGLVLRRLAFVPFVVVVGGCALNRSAGTAAGPVSPIAEASVRGHMSFLASDALNGRGSGTRDEWIAASYLGAQMQAWGLEPLGDAGSFVQQVEIERSETAAPPTLSVGDRRFTHGKEIRVIVLGSAQSSGALQKYAAGVSIQPGAIVLMHVGSHPSDGSTLDADALPGLIDQLRARGFGFVTLSALTG